MPQGRAIEGQISLFDLLSVMGRETTENVSPRYHEKRTDAAKQEMKMAVISTSLKDYLHRADIIKSLARERYQKAMENYILSDIEEILFTKVSFAENMSEDMLVDDVAKKVIRPILCRMDGSEEGSAAFWALRRLIDFNVTVEQADVSGHVSHVCEILSNKWKRSTDILRVRLCEEGWPELEAYGYRCYMNGSGRKRTNLLYTNGEKCADVATILAWLLLISMYRKAMTDREWWPFLQRKFSDFKRSAQEDPVTKQMDYDCGLYGKGPQISFKERMVIEEYAAPVVIPYDLSSRPSEETIMEFCRVTGIQREQVAISELCASKLHRKNEVYLADTGYKRPWRYLLSRSMEYALFARDPFGAYNRGLGHVLYAGLLSRTDSESDQTFRRCWALPSRYGRGFSNDFRTYFMGVLETLWEEKGQTVRTAQYYRQLAGESKSHARSFEDKKNVPQKTLKAMEESAFNRAFGFVEFDEDCDLTKAEELSCEFLAFKETYLPDFDSSQVALRFRKLGNHKASGLYYPGISCLCVDIGSPSSFVHEYGHSIDYIAGEGKNLSDRAEFHPVYERYKELLTKAVREDPTLKKERLRGKYNLNYYLLHTESFARCFEIYVTRTLGLCFSICTQDERMGFAYPKDQKLEDAIKMYFDKLVGGFGYEELPAAA